jgi:heat shock protein HslJ
VNTRSAPRRASHGTGRRLERGHRLGWSLLLTAALLGCPARAAPPGPAATASEPGAAAAAEEPARTAARGRSDAAATRGEPLPATTDPPPSDARRRALEDGVWQLDSYRTALGLKSAISGDGSGYVAFEQGGFRINAGCDTLRGNYWLEEQRLLFSPHIASTLGDCPATLRAQEQAVLALLPAIVQLREEADGMTLLDAEGRAALTLKAPEKAPLQRRLWRLLAYRNSDNVVVTALPTPHFTLRFEDAVRLSGEACDEYRGAFVRDARFLRLEGPLTGTKLGCPDAPDASRQAEDYLRALRRVDSYRVDAESLLLRDVDGRMLARFAALEPQPPVQAPTPSVADSAARERPAPLPAPSPPR